VSRTERRVGGVDAGEVLLDRRHDPPLLCQGRNRHRRLLEARLRDVDHSRAVRLSPEVVENGQEHVPVKLTINVRPHLEDVLIDDGLGSLPNKDAEGRSPRHEEIARSNCVVLLRFAIEVVEAIAGAREVLDADDRPTGFRATPTS
jgi:hypothetical protein